MKTKLFKSTVATALTLMMVVGLVCGCSSTGTEEGTTEETTTEVAVTEEGTVEEATEEASTDSSFNPDTETDKITYTELEELYGSVSDLDLPDDISLGAILKNQANEFWLALGEGMENESSDYGVSIDIQATSTETDTVGQLSIMETMLQNNYDALILSPLTNECLDSAVSTALSSDIPIVNANCEYVAAADVFVGGSQIEIGYKAADYIAEQLGEEGKVAIIEGVSGTFTSIQRVNGFNEQIVNYPDIEVVASVSGDYEMEKAMNVVTDILTANDDIDAIYCCNDNMALGAIEALRSAGKLGEVIVIGVDGTGDAYTSIHAGELTATIDQFPEINGEVAVEVALRLMAGQDIPRVVTTPIEVVDINNAADYGK